MFGIAGDVIYSFLSNFFQDSNIGVNASTILRLNSCFQNSLKIHFHTEPVNSKINKRNVIDLILTIWIKI